MATITLELFELKTICMDMAELGVANYIRTQAPAKDLISQREAYRLFQEGSTTRSKLLYSRSELLALDKSERLNLFINK